MMKIWWNLWLNVQQVEAASTAATIAATIAAMIMINSIRSAQFTDSFLHYEADYKMLICKVHNYTL